MINMAENNTEQEVEHRINLNIPGLDALFFDGIPSRSQILLSGTVGTGKTIFGLQYVYNSVVLSKEPALFATFEEHTFELRNQARRFGWKLEELEKRKQLLIKRYDPFIIDEVLSIINNDIREIKAKRVVIHTTSNFTIYLKDESDIRRTIVKFYDILKKNGCTSILICESPPGGVSISRSGVEEFVVDGVIRLRKALIGEEFKKVLNIWKMRGSEHSNKLHLYDITSHGFVVYPEKTIDISQAKIYT
jgi:KaiC/GvpD/RAD55 family RecA-like ATPase